MLPLFKAFINNNYVFRQTHTQGYVFIAYFVVLNALAQNLVDDWRNVFSLISLSRRIYKLCVISTTKGDFVPVYHGMNKRDNGSAAIDGALQTRCIINLSSCCTFWGPKLIIKAEWNEL